MSGDVGRRGTVGGELVGCGTVQAALLVGRHGRLDGRTHDRMQKARRITHAEHLDSDRVAAVMARLAAHRASATTNEALATAAGMGAVLTSTWDPTAVAAARQDGSARGLIAVHSSVGLLKHRLGALPEADGAARIAWRLLVEGDFAHGLGVGTIVASAATDSGDLDVAHEVLQRIPDGPPGVISVLVPAARARLALARGNGGGAAREFGACLSMLSPAVWGMPVRDVAYLHARSGAAEAHLLTGERAVACDLAEAELADARRLGLPRALGIALRLAGLAGLAHGARPGLALLEESVDALGASPALLERARSMTELGAALRRGGRRTAARPVLRKALDLAVGSGARSVADRARAELITAGGRPRRDRQRGPEALTPGELRVARLARDGLTNRQIAHNLYLTTKTVETHLGHAYAKLGITARGELPRALH